MYCRVVLNPPRLQFWGKFTAWVAIFPVGVKPGVRLNLGLDGLQCFCVVKFWDAPYIFGLGKVRHLKCSIHIGISSQQKTNHSITGCVAMSSATAFLLVVYHVNSATLHQASLVLRLVTVLRVYRLRFVTSHLCQLSLLPPVGCYSVS